MMTKYLSMKQFFVMLAIIIGFLTIMVLVYGNYTEKKTLCNERGGVLVKDAQNFEKYICIDKQVIIAW